MSRAHPQEPSPAANPTTPDSRRSAQAVAQHLRPANLAVLALLLCFAACNGQTSPPSSGQPPVDRTVTQAPTLPTRQTTTPPTPATVTPKSNTPTQEPSPERPGFRTPVPESAADREAAAHRSVPRPSQCYAVAFVHAYVQPLQDSVQWRPDGSVVFFTQGRNVYSVAADGAHVRQIVDPAPKGYDETQMRVSADRIGDFSAISVSPDGTQLLYSTCEYPRNYPATALIAQDYQSDIALVPIAGGEPQRLTTHDAYDSFPVWSPDGTRIAFLSARHRRVTSRAFARPHLYTMAPGAWDVRHLARNIDLINHQPQWSPDGQWLAFAGFEGVGELFERNIYLVRADGTDLRRLAAAVSGPSWSPDGQRLAFAQPEETTVALVTIAADGSDLRRLTTIEHWRPGIYGSRDEPADAWIGTVAWSPAGDLLAYECGNTFCVSTVTGVPVGKSPLVERRRSTVAWSPDGTRIAVADPSSGVVITMAPDGTDVRALVRRGTADVLTAAGVAMRASRMACTDGDLLPNPAANSGLVHDCQTLLRLRAELFGVAYSDWDLATPMTQWTGVTIEGTPRRVTEIRLPMQGLAGVLPASLGALAELRTLDLSSNELRGTIPRELRRLVNLRELDPSGNKLGGNIPEEFAALPKLEKLVLGGSQWAGCLPSRLAVSGLDGDVLSLGLPICQTAT